MRPLDMSKPHKMLLPTSGIGYWQVEIAEWPLSGDVVVWETPLRLRHLATQMYLCFKPDESVSGGYKAVLTCDGGNAVGSGSTHRGDTWSCLLVGSPVTEPSQTRRLVHPTVFTHPTGRGFKGVSTALKVSVG